MFIKVTLVNWKLCIQFVLVFRAVSHRPVLGPWKWRNLTTVTAFYCHGRGGGGFILEALSLKLLGMVSFCSLRVSRLAVLFHRMQRIEPNQTYKFKKRKKKQPTVCIHREPLHAPLPHPHLDVILHRALSLLILDHPGCSTPLSISTSVSLHFFWKN